MLNDEGLRYLLPESVRNFPADLWLVVAAVVAAWVVAFVSVTGNPVAGAVAALFVLFVPGYAIVAALFPADGRRTGGQFVDARVEIDFPERLALSVGMSIAVAPFVGLLIGLTPVGARPVPIVVAVGGLSLLAAIVAAIRREALPADERFSVIGLYEGRTPPFRAPTRSTGDRLAVAAVALAVLVTLGTITYVGFVPRTGEEFSELYLLSQDEDGSLVADDYPDELVQGEPATFTVGVENHEGERVSYTVVTVLQRVDGGEVTQQEVLRRFQADLERDGTWRLRHRVEPTMTGENLRLTYLLYSGSVPERPSLDSADEEVHVWVDVTQPDAT